MGYEVKKTERTGSKKGCSAYWGRKVFTKDNIAEVPELPGCMADGTTYHEALSNVEVIIQEWIETAKELKRPIPQPKDKQMYA